MIARLLAKGIGFQLGTNLWCGGGDSLYGDIYSRSNSCYVID